jgi:hypothetical protein
MATSMALAEGHPTALTPATELRDAIAPFGPVSLAEIEALAALQVRRDRKYLVPPERIATLIACAAAFEQPRVLEIGGERLFRYESLYFDTPALASYFDAAHRRPRRRKVRTRSYVDSDTCMLEVKARDNRGRTVKHRLPYEMCHRRELTETGRALMSSYRRATLLFEESGLRATIDVDLAWCDPAENHLAAPRLVLVETKSLTFGSFFDRLLWRFGHRPAAISKYCTGLAALTPGLQANKWHRTLQIVRALNAGVPAAAVFHRAFPAPRELAMGRAISMP